MRHKYALTIPVSNEAESIGAVLDHVPRGLFCQIIVVNSGSLDRTAELAAAAGAEVVNEPRRGYGQACLSDSLRGGIRILWTVLRCSVFPLTVTGSAASSRPERSAGNELV